MDDDSFTPAVFFKTVRLTITLVLAAVLFPAVGSTGEITGTPPERAGRFEGQVLGIRHPHPHNRALNGTPSLSPATPRRNMGRDLKIPRGIGKKSALFHPIIVKAANRHEVDPALIKAIIMVESRYNPNAVSRQGAKGLMQLMPATARALGVEDVFDPEHNVNGGVKYLKQLLNEFNQDLRLAVAAYNAGSSKVRRYRGIPPIAATRRYVDRVFKYYRYFRKRPADKTGDV